MLRRGALSSLAVKSRVSSSARYFVTAPAASKVARTHATCAALATGSATAEPSIALEQPARAAVATTATAATETPRIRFTVLASSERPAHLVHLATDRTMGRGHSDDEYPL